MSARSYTAAGDGLAAVVDLEGGSGSGTVRHVSLQSLKAAWRSLRFVTLDPGSSVGPRALEGSEVIVFVVRGSVTAVLPCRRELLDVGGYLALPVGATLEIVNEGEVQAEFVAAELGVR